MAPKKATLTTIATHLEKIETRMRQGFASADKKFEAIADDIADIKRDMATADELAAVKKELGDRITGVESKVDGINRRLDTEALTRGDQKIPERVEAIEKHLGINKKIAA